MISAEIFPCRNIRHRLLFRDIRQAMHLYGLVIIQISAEPFTHALIKADGWIEVEQLVRKEINFLANVKICPAGKCAGIKLSALADGLLPFDELDLLLDNLDHGV